MVKDRIGRCFRSVERQILLLAWDQAMATRPWQRRDCTGVPASVRRIAVKGIPKAPLPIRVPGGGKTWPSWSWPSSLAAGVIVTLVPGLTESRSTRTVSATRAGR
jgi:hypothetical protein